MKRLCLFLFLVLLAACGPRVVVWTATPLPPPPPTFEAPTPTIECSPTAIDHRCFLDKVVNPNAFFDPPPLTVSPNLTRYSVVHSNGSVETVVKDVQVPGPKDLYQWTWDMVGNDGGRSIPNWLPSIYYKYPTTSYEANISSASGSLLLFNNQLTLQAGQKYLLKVTYRLRLKSLSGKPYEVAKLDWQEFCRLEPYRSSPPWVFPVQGLNEARQSWEDNVLEEIVVSFQALKALTVRGGCGVHLAWPSWEGFIDFESFELIPVNWADADIMLQIE